MGDFGRNIIIVKSSENDNIKTKYIPNIVVIFNNIINISIFITVLYNLYFVINIILLLSK